MLDLSLATRILPIQFLPFSLQKTSFKQASLQIMMNDYAELGDVRNAELSYEKLRKLQGNNRTQERLRWSINTLIKACSNAGNLERAEYWNQYLEKMGMQQNDMGFGKLMEAGT